jgi:NCS1 family nucleobase:cation symporter-1
VQNILSSIFSNYQHMPNHFPASAHMDTKQFIGWVIFNVLMAPILYIRPEGMRFVVLIMNIISAITLICIMIYLLSAAGGAGPLLTEPSSVQTGSELGWVRISRYKIK